MKQKHRSFAFILAILMILTLASCSSGGTQAPNTTSQSSAAPQSGTPEPSNDLTLPTGLNKTGRTIRIGATLPNYNLVHWVNMAWEWQRLADANNCELTFVHAGGYENVEKQINQIQDFIANKVDVIIVGCVDAEALVQVIDKALEAGIPVIEANNMSNNPRSYAKVKSDDFSMGEQVADLLCEALGSKGKVVMLNAPGGTTPTIRGQGFRARVEDKYPDIEILAEQFVVSDPAKATAAMEDLIQTYPEIDGVFSWGDTMTVSAASVIATQNKKALISGIDIANPGVREGLRAGTIHSVVAQQPVIVALMSFEYAMKAVNGEPNSDTNPFIAVPSMIATKDNIDTVDLSGVLQPNDKR